MTETRSRLVTAVEIRKRGDELAEFEREFTYPLGDDSFRIDHGADYLAFFEGLGDPVVVLAEQRQRVVGVLVAVCRPDPLCWYVCDLKITATARTVGLARRMLGVWIAGRDLVGFGVVMDPARGANRMARIAPGLLRVALEVGPRLRFYSLDFAAWGGVSGVLERELGPIAFHDPRGTKDIVLRSSGEAMPLLHAQYGRSARAGSGPPRPGHVHMLCLPDGDPLIERLSMVGVLPTASATVLHHRMPRHEWRSLLTSDI
ncbi:MAG: hypothetical protein KDC87_04935 [Planctomycetes bacterium]|nr:hypothetical protein [Planctomycetota bacterium]MCB9868791.1 hypothetical protein [Planctomycetota bacterium]